MKKILVLIGLLLTTLNLIAEPIGEQRARAIATEFFAEHSTRTASGAIELEWAGSSISEACHMGNELNTSLLYIYTRGAEDGFVIVAGDSNIEPIIAYSLDSTLDVNNIAEATLDILDAWCRQVKDARQAAAPISGASRLTTRTNDALLYDTALWNQGEPYNREAPIINGQRSVTGCVATAMSIICYYNRWPESGTGTTPAYQYEDADGITRNVAANTLGRKYNYSSMLMDYNNGFTTAQGDAVAALMKDMGTAVMMMYHPTGSGAYDQYVLEAFSKYFHYSKGCKLARGDGYDAENWNNIIRENVREYGPTYFSGGSNSGGHAFVVDGFDNDYFHFNFGWGGVGNGYYMIPDIEYYIEQLALLYLEPDYNGTSTYRDDICLYGYSSYAGIAPYQVTSYATGKPFYCITGGFANLGATTFNGEVKLVLCDRYGNWKEELCSYSITSLEPNYVYWGDYEYITITSTLNEGDRMRVYYKGSNTTEWQWARCYDISTAYDEILVMGSPEDMAKGLTFIYDKPTRTLYLDSKHAAKVEIYNASSNELLSTTNIEHHGNIMITDIEAGTYRCEVSLGSEPYTLVVRL